MRALCLLNLQDRSQVFLFLSLFKSITLPLTIVICLLLWWYSRQIHQFSLGDLSTKLISSSHTLEDSWELYLLECFYSAHIMNIHMKMILEPISTKRMMIFQLQTYGNFSNTPYTHLWKNVSQNAEGFHP